MTIHFKDLCLLIAALGVLLLASFSRSTSAACLIMGFAEGAWFARIVLSYRTDEPETFLSRASLEDVIRARLHAVNALMLVQLATIMALLGRS